MEKVKLKCDKCGTVGDKWNYDHQYVVFCQKCRPELTREDKGINPGGNEELAQIIASFGDLRF